MKKFMVTLFVHLGSLLLIAGSAARLVAASEAGPPCEVPEVIRFSMTPASDAETEGRLYGPLAKRIEGTTGKRVLIVRPKSYSGVIENLLGGNVDVAVLGPASYIEAKKGDSQLTPFATIERRSGPFQAQGAHYQSLLVALASSRFTSVDSLRGMTLTLTDPASTSGALLPRKRFIERYQIPVEQFFRSVGYSGNHAKSLQRLLHGEADAAFVASDQLEYAAENGLLSANQVRVLWRSEAIPFDPFVYRGQLCEPLKRQIRDAFFGDSALEELRDILNKLHAHQFVRTNDAAYDGLRRVLGAD